MRRKLLNGVGMTRSSPIVAESLHTALKFIFFSIGMRAALSVALHFSFERVRTSRSRSQQYNVVIWRSWQNTESPKMMHCIRGGRCAWISTKKRSGPIMFKVPWSFTGAYFVRGKYPLHLVPMHLLAARIYQLLHVDILWLTRCTLVISSQAGQVWSIGSCKCKGKLASFKNYMISDVSCNRSAFCCGCDVSCPRTQNI